MRTFQECKEARRLYGLTIRAVAEYTGITASMLARYERRDSCPDYVLVLYNEVLSRYESDSPDDKDYKEKLRAAGRGRCGIYNEFTATKQQVRRLKLLRLSLNVNQRELSRFLNMSQTAYSRRELGDTRFELEVYKKCIDYLNKIKTRRNTDKLRGKI